MKYRQWKKNYKKRHGVNPPIEIDKRKQRRDAKRAVKQLGAINWGETLSRAAEVITEAAARIMRGMANGFDAAGTICRNVADNMQPLEIKGTALSWEVKEICGDWGIYENNTLDGSKTLKLITNSRTAAEKIVEIIEKDELEHMRLNYPERIRRREDATDALAYGLAAAQKQIEGALTDA